MELFIGWSRLALLTVQYCKYHFFTYCLCAVNVVGGLKLHRTCSSEEGVGVAKACAGFCFCVIVRAIASGRLSQNVLTARRGMRHK